MHREHHKMMIQDFKRRFWVSLILTIPILILSPLIQTFLHYQWQFWGSEYVLFLLSTLVYFYGGWPFLRGGYNELKSKNPGMMTLIGLAVTVAYVYSAAIVFGLSGKMFFWELVTLIDIMLLGHWIEMRSVLGASRALELLVKMMPSTAHLVKGATIKDVALNQLKEGDVVLIKPGEKIPADGRIVEGSSYLDESMLTGESKPVKKEVGIEVIGGSINGQGSLKIEIKHAGKDSYLSKVIQLVGEAQQVKSKTQRFADKAAKWLTFVALFAGFATFAVWLFIVGQPVDFSLERMVTVLVISCPHALGLAIPLVVAISTTLSAQRGLLIRNRTAFENARKITTLVFDKTGTLTKGKFGVARYESLNERYRREDILKYAGSLEQYSEHPIAAGIIRLIKDKHIILPKVQNFKALVGQGVEAQVEGKNIKVVSSAYIADKNILLDSSLYQSILSNGSETAVFILIENQLAGYIVLADEIRLESYEAIKTLKDKRIKTVMMTGDNEAVAKAVSKALGIDTYYAEVLPHQKLAYIKAMQEQGEFVAMTGDGVNDAPALAQADIGIAIGSGTDIAAETADIILVESNPRDIVALIAFGRATYRKMIQNLIWATGYNAFAIPLAAGVLSRFGFVLSPAIGAVLMSLSTVIVALNAQLIKVK
ncbi:MAG: copper-translocating P-type ATPase [Gammaproteobacteria bacterium]|nr:copper-translocating P-type ATPase [Gammaproteobacteria bacterium]